MGKYLLIESRDPFESADVGFFSDLTAGIVSKGHSTILFLTQNGVLSARKGSKFNERLMELIKDGVRVLADDFSIKERAVGTLVEGVEVSTMDEFVDLLFEPGIKAVWH